MQGVLSTRDAIARAFAVGLDLVEISPNAEPPVAKILDYGKFKYEQQKKRNEARKKQKIVEIKEVESPSEHRRERLPGEAARDEELYRRGRQGEGDPTFPWP